MALPSISTSIRRTTPTEKLLYASNPLVIGSTRDVVQKAYQEAERRFPPHTQEDGDGDAFRHCYAAALLVREIGVNNTIALTEAHEVATLHDWLTPATAANIHALQRFVRTLRHDLGAVESGSPSRGATARSKAPSTDSRRCGDRCTRAPASPSCGEDESEPIARPRTRSAWA